MGHGPSLYPWAENIALRDAAGLAFFSHVSRGAAHISQKEKEARMILMTMEMATLSLYDFFFFG